MDSVHLGLALLNTAAFVLCVLFLSYVVTVLRPFLRHREVELGDRADFDWHILIPCLNEETVIVGTVQHLLDTFPEATVWCIDDDSRDHTHELITWLATRHEKVRVVSRRPPEARKGKGDALNDAYRRICAELPEGADRSRVVVGVVDADGRLEQFCPDVISGPGMFGDPTVGAVQVQVRITEDVDALVGTDLDRLVGSRARTKGDHILVRLQDLEFAGPIAAMQFLRRRTGSVAMGGNGQFTRLTALDDVAREHGTPWHGALLEDFELGLHVLLAGHRTEYCHDTFVAQDGLSKVKPLLRQRTRWSQGNIQCLRYLWGVLNSERISIPGALEIAHYMWVPFSQVFGSVVFPLTTIVMLWSAPCGSCRAYQSMTIVVSGNTIVMLWYALHDPQGADQWLLAGAWGLIPLGLLFGVLPHALWGFFYRTHCGTFVTRRGALWMAVANIGYGYLLQVCAWRALFRVLKGHTEWHKTARANDRPVVETLTPVPSS